MCKFFIVSGNRQVLLGIPDTDMLNIININCITTDTHGADSANNCSTNTAICQSSRHMQHYTNMMQDANRAEEYYANIDSISIFKNKISQWLLIKSLTQ